VVSVRATFEPVVCRPRLDEIVVDGCMPYAAGCSACSRELPRAPRRARFNPSILLRPAFDPLRGDAHFKALVQAISLPTESTAAGAGAS
jgi:hypothetical protein